MQAPPSDRSSLADPDRADKRLHCVPHYGRPKPLQSLVQSAQVRVHAHPVGLRDLP